MKKKTRRRILWGIWALAVVAIAALWLVRSHLGAPSHKVWRAPVALSNLVLDLPQLPRPVLPKETSSLYGPYEENIPGAEPLLPEPLPHEQPSPIPMPPHPVPSGKGGVIAILIDDMGLVPSLSERAARLPASVTLSYLPYAPKLQTQVDDAKARGHEIMLHLPMEPLGHQNAGPGTLTTAMNNEEVRDRTYAALESFDGYDGVNNHMGSKFTMDVRGMGVVADVIHERGVFFLDSRTSGQTVVTSVMHAAGVPTAGRDVFLDDDLSPQAIWKQLARLEVLARRQGGAIAIGHPHAATLQALEGWIPQAEARGIRLVQVKELIH